MALHGSMSLQIESDFVRTLVIVGTTEHTFSIPITCHSGNTTVLFPTLQPRTRASIRHDVVIKWKHFLSYWPFVWGIHRPPVNSPHKGQWRGALMFSLICARINGGVNNRETSDLRRNRAHYDVTVMLSGRTFLQELMKSRSCQILV